MISRKIFSKSGSMLFSVQLCAKTEVLNGFVQFYKEVRVVLK